VLLSRYSIQVSHGAGGWKNTRHGPRRRVGWNGPDVARAKINKLGNANPRSFNSGILAYDRTFDLFGQTGSVAIVLPYFHGNLSGNVGGDDKQITRQGSATLLSASPRI
jgi:hypothetical protein